MSSIDIALVVIVRLGAAWRACSCIGRVLQQFRPTLTDVAVPRPLTEVCGSFSAGSPLSRGSAESSLRRLARQGSGSARHRFGSPAQVTSQENPQRARLKYLGTDAWRMTRERCPTGSPVTIARSRLLGRGFFSNSNDVRHPTAERCASCLGSPMCSKMAFVRSTRVSN